MCPRNVVKVVEGKLGSKMFWGGGVIAQWNSYLLLNPTFLGSILGFRTFFSERFDIAKMIDSLSTRHREINTNSWSDHLELVSGLPLQQKTLYLISAKPVSSSRLGLAPPEARPVRLLRPETRVGAWGRRLQQHVSSKPFKQCCGCCRRRSIPSLPLSPRTKRDSWIEILIKQIYS